MSAFCTNTIFPNQANTWTVFWATVHLGLGLLIGAYHNEDNLPISLWVTPNSHSDYTKCDIFCMVRPILFDSDEDSASSSRLDDKEDQTPSSPPPEFYNDTLSSPQHAIDSIGTNTNQLHKEVSPFQKEYGPEAENCWQELSLDAPGLPPLSPTSTQAPSSPPPEAVCHGHEYHPFLTGLYIVLYNSWLTIFRCDLWWIWQSL